MEAGRAGRVLVVDDNELARRIIKTVAVTEGWEVCAEARDGQEAVQMMKENLMKENSPDLVILDFMMPVKDGLQTAREILQIHPSLPIVLHTLYYTEQLRALAEEIGVRRVVVKTNYRALTEVLSAFRHRCNPIDSPN